MEFLVSLGSFFTQYYAVRSFSSRSCFHSSHAIGTGRRKCRIWNRTLPSRTSPLVLEKARSRCMRSGSWASALAWAGALTSTSSSTPYTPRQTRTTRRWQTGRPHQRRLLLRMIYLSPQRRHQPRVRPRRPSLTPIRTTIERGLRLGPALCPLLAPLPRHLRFHIKTISPMSTLCRCGPMRCQRGRMFTADDDAWVRNACSYVLDLAEVICTLDLSNCM